MLYPTIQQAKYAAMMQQKPGQYIQIIRQDSKFRFEIRECKHKNADALAELNDDLVIEFAHVQQKLAALQDELAELRSEVLQQRDSKCKQFVLQKLEAIQAKQHPIYQ